MFKNNEGMPPSGMNPKNMFAIHTYIGGSVILLSILISQIGIQRRGFARDLMSDTSATAMEQTVEARIGFKGI
jgi:hypothetical protein